MTRSSEPSPGLPFGDRIMLAIGIVIALGLLTYFLFILLPKIKMG